MPARPLLPMSSCKFPVRLYSTCDPVNSTSDTRLQDTLGRVQSCVVTTERVREEREVERGREGGGFSSVLSQGGQKTVYFFICSDN